MAGRTARLPLRVLRGLCSLMLALALAGVCYLAAILTMPEGDGQGAPAEQPLPAASPALTVREEESLRQLAASCPVPMLALMSGTPWRFVSGTAADTAFEGGLARVCTLRYTAAEGQDLTLETVCPARALALLGREGWTLTGQGPALVGVPSVRMEREGLIRLHAQGETALYAVTLPDLGQEMTEDLLRCLTLVEPE